MKIRENLYSAVFVSVALISFLILVSSTASASITEKRITTNSSNSEYPAIYGNKIVWQDDRNGNWDIYIQDLSTKNQIHTTNLLDQINPVIYEDRVVWEDYRNGNPNIYVQNLSTKKQTRISTDGAYQRNPAIYGNRIVWEDYRNGPPDINDANGNSDIYMYDLSTKNETRITTSGLAWDPAIYGDRIVWNDWRNGNLSVYMYDIPTKTETRITSKEQGRYPAIYGNRIVWIDTRNGDLDIYMYDVSTKNETRITTNSSESWFPAIYGNTIVWEDNRNGISDVYLYDLSTHQEIHTIGKSDKCFPDIYGDRIVWMDNRNGYYDSSGNWNNWDIYMGTISYLPVAAFSASSTTGNHPLNVQFTDESTDEYYYSWNFGDKSALSTLENPVHKYTKAGKYTVTLTVKNAAGSNTAKKTSYITVK